jgi:Ca2+/Na+ antiporter
MLTLNSAPESKNSFSATDLIFISVILLVIFAVYIYKLLTSYAREEAEVRENLSMSEKDIEQRLELVYENVKPSSFWTIALLFVLGIFGAFIGGHEISGFASTMIRDLDINPILTALILALFAGLSEYVILWQSHRKGEYGIALANAFGGITQVMFLVLPFTLLWIALYQGFLNPAHPELPLEFSTANIFLLLFLFPTFYTLSSLLEEDHTLGVLDTTIMTGIFLFLIVLLVSYGGVPA